MNYFAYDEQRALCLQTKKQRILYIHVIKDKFFSFTMVCTCKTTGKLCAYRNTDLKNYMYPLIYYIGYFSIPNANKERFVNNVKRSCMLTTCKDKSSTKLHIVKAITEFSLRMQK